MQYFLKMFLAMLVAVIPGMRVSANALSPVTIPVCGEAPIIDGNLDDSAWNEALIITNFITVGAPDGTPPAASVKAKIMRDAEWLFVGFDIRHPTPALITPRAKHRNERVQGENCVKIAFDPGTDGKQWYHIRLSAGNVISDQRNTAGGSDQGWNLPMRSATRITETGWQAEIALPFSMILDAGDPDKATINLLAYTFIPALDQQGIATGEETREVASWASVQPAWWQAPERFIPIAGLADAVFKAPFLPMLDGVTVGAYRYVDDSYVYDVSGVMRNFSSWNGRINIRVRDMPVVGQPADTTSELTLLGGDDVNWRVTVPVAAVVRRDIQVAMESESGELLQSMLIEAPAVLDMFSAYLDRNYYTVEQEAGVVCRIGLPAAGLKETLLRVRTEDGETLGEMHEVQTLSAWSFSIEKIEEGVHPICIELRRTDGVLIADQATTLIKRAPKPGCEWKIDQANRVILNNGQPFFPFGVIFSTAEEENFKEISEAGFNSIAYWQNIADPINARKILDLAKKYDLNVIIRPDSFATNSLTSLKVEFVLHRLKLDDSRIAPFFTPAPDDTRTKTSELTKAEKSHIFALAYEANLERILSGCSVINDRPNLIGYKTFDEPRGPEYFDQWVQGFDLYNKVNQEDGYRPWFVIAHPPEFDFCEVVGYDAYWVPGRDGVRGSPRRVLGWSRYYHQRTAPSRKVIWHVPLAERWSGTYKRFLLPQEQLCQTYLLLIDGCKALFYFVYPVIHQSSFEVLANLAQQMQTLGPACVAPDVPQTITYIPDSMENLGGAPDDGTSATRYPDVLVKLFANPKGGFILLAANSKKYPVDVEYTVSLLGQSGQVKRLFADNTYLIDNGQFKDQLEAYGVRAYEIKTRESTASKEPPEPFQITVAMTAHLEQEKIEEFLPHSGRPGRKNIMPNPSFEEASLPGFPDYWGIANAQPVQLPRNRTGREEAFYSLDTENPYHGQHSFRMRSLPRRSPMPGFSLRLQHDRPAEYVWSFYMRADRDGVRVLAVGDGVDGKSISYKHAPVLTLTTEWQRYHVNVIVKPGNKRKAYWLRMMPEENSATFWVDAMQFEQGVAPTAFDP